MLRRSLRRAFISPFGGDMLPPLRNEPGRHYPPASEDAVKLAAAVKRLREAEPVSIPIVIGDKELRPGKPLTREVPSERHKVMHTYHVLDKANVETALESSRKAAASWFQQPFHERATVMLRAAELITGRYRYDVMAATMLNQSKNVWQAEIDCIEEAADFLRFNTKWAADLQRDQPFSPRPDTWNLTEYRPLEGFTLALSPFNFTAIGMNLASAPALMGNSVIWKPSEAALLSSYVSFKILREAGVPPGVINFVPCDIELSQHFVSHPDLAAIAFTGSTETFTRIWENVGRNVRNYRSFPKLTGETGGKNFHLVHPSADLNATVSQTLRSAFEYQGQKCSACSRVFVPKSIWPQFEQRLVAGAEALRMGGPEDFSNFMCAVITEQSYRRSCQYISAAEKDPDCKVLTSRRPSDEVGWFVPPTIVQVPTPTHKLLTEEIFGPVLGVYVYDDSAPNFWADMCTQVNAATPYALTGAIFAEDRNALVAARDALRYTAGNLYLNDKSTGAVVGQQPFGGSRKSGTNDKPGSPQYLRAFVSPRTVKETFVLNPNVSYPHQLPHSIRVE
jgi:1-pyrroline-5-carboxylate dehydrogenase